MKKLIVGVTLVLFTAIAHAQWVEISSTSSGDKFFVDPVEQMGAGTLVASENTPNEQWAHVPPGTVRQTTMNFACR